MYHALGTRLNGSFRKFIGDQPVFFVATAADTGRVNLSPKGADTLRILSETRIQWLNLSGSGNEAAGHLRLCNRMTLMFCAFRGDALILRVYGTANILHPRNPGWAEAAAQFPDYAGARQIFDMTIDTLQTSCGSGVPRMTYEKDRVADELTPFYADMGPDGVSDYWKKKNLKTIDGFPTALLDDD